MTGRDLIVYILQNNLENEEFFNNGKIPGCISVEEAAVKMNVGTATILVWVSLKKLDYIKIGGRIYICENCEFVNQWEAENYI